MFRFACLASLRLVASIGVLSAGLAAARAAEDAAIFDITECLHYGPVGTVHAYAAGISVCNVGDQNLDWVAASNQHPLQSWSVYRLSDGRIEQLGLSWMKHGYFAASTPGCGPCNTLINGTRLGVGCRDTYSAGSDNSYQPGLGARFEVNAATGSFVWPFYARGMAGDAVYKRCQVEQADLIAGAQYFLEASVVHPDDAAAGNNRENNFAYRRVVLGTGYSLTPSGSAVLSAAAIRAWRDHGLGIGVPDPSVVLTPIDVAGDGRFWVGSKVSDLGGGQWRYEYAVENLTSDRSGASFRVALPSGAAVNSTRFHGVRYHSGDPYSNADWVLSMTPEAIEWHSPQTFAQNANTNALRFGTLCNFSFVADVPPTSGLATLGLFKPGGAGSPAEVSAGAMVPQVASPCPTDLNGDRATDLIDLATLLANFGLASGATHAQGDVDGDGDVDLTDLAGLLVEFGVACG